MHNYNKLLLAYWGQLTFVVCLGFSLFFFGQWKIETNILALLPELSMSVETQKAQQALFADKEHQVLIAISGDNAIAAHQALNHTLTQGLDKVTSVTVNKVTLPTPQDISQFYAPYRNNFISPSNLTRLNNSDAFAENIAQQLTQITNPFVSETLGIDPRLILADYLNTEFNKLEDMESVQGIASIQYNNKQYFILTLSLNVDSLSLKKSQLVSRQLQDIFTKVSVDFNCEIIFSGILFHTAESSLQAEAEITTFGFLSLLGIIILILMVFRSVIPLSIAIMVISLAIFYGLTSLMLFFEQLHLLTLVFAVTLIGIVIDYCFHAFVYIQKNKNISKEETEQHKIVRPLILGFITTALGYAALMFSPLLLLTQVAVFMVFGLLGALLTVIILLPKIKLTAKIKVAPSAIKTIEFITVKIAWLVKWKLPIFALFITLLAIKLNSSFLHFNDDVHLLNSSPPWLLKHEATMAKVMNYHKLQRVIITAESAEDLLVRQEEVLAQLAKNQQELLFQSIAGLLPSAQQQRQHYQRLKQAEQENIFEQGLKITGLTIIMDEFIPLTYELFSKGALQEFSDLYIANYSVIDEHKSKRYALWFAVSGEPLNAINLTWLNQQKDINIFNKADDISNALSMYRQGLLTLLMVSFIVVGLILFQQYGLTRGAIGLLSIACSAIAALLMTQLFLTHLNIFNLFALLLVLALAIDYVIFYQEHGLQPRTLLAITLSAISSALVFGMLAFSMTPAVESFGMTVMFGIIFIFILAPLSSPKNLNSNLEALNENSSAQ